MSAYRCFYSDKFKFFPFARQILPCYHCKGCLLQRCWPTSTGAIWCV